ncbi:hypothetical protein ABZP21_27665, partial [Pseudomonas sp. AP-1]
PDHLTVQSIALVGQQLMLVKGHAQHVTAAVGERADFVATTCAGSVPSLYKVYTPLQTYFYNG